MERRAARWSDRLVAVCADMADRAAAAGLAPREAIRVVYSAIDTGRFLAAEGERQRLRREWGVTDGAFVLVKVARLAPMKGHEFVLPAFAQAARGHPEAVLALAGDGVLRARLEAEAARLGVARQVRFLGLVPTAEVPGVLWASDAVVHASLREGLARVLAEGGLCRRPVITYDIGGAREVMRDGVNGLLLPPPGRPRTDWLRPAFRWSLSRSTAMDNIASGIDRAPRPWPQGTGPVALVEDGDPPWRPLAEAMRRLLDDPAAARRMGEAWPQDVLQRFDHRAATAEITRVYEEVLRVQGGRAGEGP
jgi:glycosyltransferase involved in cell wall biosynthesis